MEVLIVTILSVILSSILNSEMDTIAEFQRQYYRSLESYMRLGVEFSQTWLINTVYSTVKRKPWFRTPFWVLRVQWKNTIQKTLFSALGDGWHLTKSLRVYFAFLPATILVLQYFNVAWYYCFIVNFVTMLIQGVFFELSYEK